MKIRAADPGERNARLCFANPGARARDFINANLVHSMKYKRFHILHIFSSFNIFLRLQIYKLTNGKQCAAVPTGRNGRVE